MIKKRIITALTVAAVFVASVMPVCAGSPSTKPKPKPQPQPQPVVVQEETPAPAATTTEDTGSSSSSSSSTTAPAPKAATVVDAGASEAALAAAMSAAGFDISAVDANTKAALIAAIQNLLFGNLTNTGNAFGNAAITAAAGDASKTVKALLLALADVKPQAGTAADANGFYTITMNVAGVNAGDTIAILHYTGSAWETIVGAAGNGTVTFKVKGLSPIAVVKLTVNGAVTAPQTGSDMFAVYALALMGIAGAAYCGKKYLAK